jgi:VWFA-related protein
VTLNVIGSIEGQSPSIRLPLRSVLTRIAETTGGQAFFPSGTKELDRVYSRVLAEVRAQYTLGYLSTNTQADGSWREVEVTVRRPGSGRVRIRARKGYYALYRP